MELHHMSHVEVGEYGTLLEWRIICPTETLSTIEPSRIAPKAVRHEITWEKTQNTYCENSAFSSTHKINIKELGISIYSLVTPTYNNNQHAKPIVVSRFHYSNSTQWFEPLIPQLRTWYYELLTQAKALPCLSFYSAYYCFETTVRVFYVSPQI
jgi:hypothetical protein